MFQSSMLDFKFISLMSGSKGNASIIQTKESTILIDCGGPKRYLMEALMNHGITLDSIDACFITHTHSDHIQQIKTFAHRPIYACQPIQGVNTTQISLHDRIDINECVITPFYLSHDVPNVGYIIHTQLCKIVCVTDTGYLKNDDIALLHNAHFYYFECNYEPALLMTSSRPHSVKMRTLSDSGHLSNDDSARIMKSLIGPQTHEVMLAHISEDANTLSLALRAHHEAWFEDYPHIKLQCAKQFEVTTGGKYD